MNHLYEFKFSTVDLTTKYMSCGKSYW